MNSDKSEKALKRKKQAEKTWHRIFILLIICSLIVATASSIRRVHAEQAINKELASSTLPQSEKKTNGIMILCYHRILKPSLATTIAQSLSNNRQLHDYAITTTVFRSHLAYLKKHKVEIISLDKAVAMVASGKPIARQYAVITFDDVDSTVYANAFPILKRLNYSFTVFVITSQTGSYDKGTSLATWSQIRRMVDSPLVTVGLHTNNMHLMIKNKPVLTSQQGTERFAADYQTSQKILTQRLGITARYFAYPYGESTKSAQKYLTKKGIITAGLTDGVIHEYTSLSQPLPRSLVTVKSWEKVVKPWIR